MRGKVNTCTKTNVILLYSLNIDALNACGSFSLPVGAW